MQLAESFDHLAHASQMIDVRMSQDDPFEFDTAGEFLERCFEQVGVYRHTLARVEQ